MKNWLKHETFYEDSYYIERVLPKAFKTLLNEGTGGKIEVPANILKHSFGYVLDQYVKVAYDFETKFVKFYETEIKLEELRGKMINHIL